MDKKFWEQINTFGENGEFDKIVREIKKLPEEKLNIELINALGRAYINLGDYENALNTYLSYIGKNKEDFTNADIWIYSECGWLCNEVGDYEQGLKYLLEAEKLGRDDEWLNTEVGQCLGRLGRAEEGITRLKKSLKLIETEAPENINEKVFINSEIGYLYGFLEIPEEALKYFYITKDLGRNDEWLYMHLWFNLERFKGKEEALKYFENEVKNNDKNAVLWASLGQVYMNFLENYEEAEKAFKKAFELSGDGLYLYNRGIALRTFGRYEEAVEILLQSRKISVQEGDVTDGEDSELVRCYVALKDKENAKKYLESAKEGVKNIPEEHVNEYKNALKKLEDSIAKI
ncbi:tetratricopeptide repeat protein [Fusobacterium animalis]|uniref:tetratricopeptide repeat protein n=1 Tax=Fusobacterium animalis TaxID=76859 RepID=UPI0034E04561